MKTFTEYLNEASKVSLIKTFTNVCAEWYAILSKEYKDISQYDFKASSYWNQTTKTKIIKIVHLEPRKEVERILDMIDKKYVKETLRSSNHYRSFEQNGYIISFNVSNFDINVKEKYVEVEIIVRKKTSLNEAVETRIEVNVDFSSKTERESFLKKFTKEGFSVEFGKNKYAETATLTGDKTKIIKFLKSMGYSEEEISIKK
jgi:hypothetical protein